MDNRYAPFHFSNSDCLIQKDKQLLNYGRRKKDIEEINKFISDTFIDKNSAFLTLAFNRGLLSEDFIKTEIRRIFSRYYRKTLGRRYNTPSKLNKHLKFCCFVEQGKSLENSHVHIIINLNNTSFENFIHPFPIICTDCYFTFISNKDTQLRLYARSLLIKPITNRENLSKYVLKELNLLKTHKYDFQSIITYNMIFDFKGGIYPF